MLILYRLLNGTLKRVQNAAIAPVHQFNMSNNPSARDRQMFRPSEVSDCSARSELCIAAPTSLSKEHAKFFTGSVLLKGEGKSSIRLLHYACIVVPML